MNNKYIGEQTTLAQKNFPFSVPHVSLHLIKTIALIKYAAAKANAVSGNLDAHREQAICTAAEEIIAGKHDQSFTLPFLQGGAGTSINMNVNEVIALRATEILKEKNYTLPIHSLDHVNMYQSTNDVNPSALRIVSLQLLQELSQALSKTIDAFEAKKKEYSQVFKVGRTHMQDAVPITFGDEFGAYAAIVKKHFSHIEQSKTSLFELNLGGTAVGNTLNVPKGYREQVYKILTAKTNLPLKPAKNMMSLTSSCADFCFVSSAIHLLCIDLSKIATDIRFMASGPLGGIGEITIENLQYGSSIMPGKVNPVLPESINQLSYFVTGKHLTLCQAAENGHLELAVMFPLVADSLISSIQTTTDVLNAFSQSCIKTLCVNEERAHEILQNTTAYATLFTPLLGYDIVSDAVKESIRKHVSFKKVLLQKNLVTEKTYTTIISNYLKKQL
jgi:aspartate ammonia-lyase